MTRSLSESDFLEALKVVKEALTDEVPLVVGGERIGFNMSVYRSSDPSNLELNRLEDPACGSVACIAGSVTALLLGVDAPDGAWSLGEAYRVDAGFGGRFDTLCHPRFEETQESLSPMWSRITPAQAVGAIDNFLRTGHARWGEVLGI